MKGQNTAIFLAIKTFLEFKLLQFMGCSPKGGRKQQSRKLNENDG